MLRLPNFNMLFQLVLTKFFKSELFSCLPKVDHVIKSCKEPIIPEIRGKSRNRLKRQLMSFTMAKFVLHSVELSLGLLLKPKCDNKR